MTRTRSWWLRPSLGIDVIHQLLDRLLPPLWTPCFALRLVPVPVRVAPRGGRLWSSPS